MRQNQNKGMGGRWVVFLLISVLASSVSFAANRAQTYIESRKKAYDEETGKIEAGMQKKKEEVLGKINAEVLAGIDESCKQGRLDMAEQFYAIKAGVEKGRNVSDEELTPLADKASGIREMLKERDMEEEKGNQQISEINLKYLNQCQDLLRRTKEIDNSQFNDLVAYKLQLTLPFGAVSPRDGKKVGGLDCRIYEGSFSDLHEIKGGRELARVFIPAVGILWGMPGEDFGAVWEGFYYVEKEGEYEFTLTADDVARFSVEGRRIAEARSGASRPVDKGKISLSRGWHPVKLEYLQKKGASGLKLQVRSPGQASNQDIPPSSFSVNRGEAIAAGS